MLSRMRRLLRRSELLVGVELFVEHFAVANAECLRDLQRSLKVLRHIELPRGFQIFIILIGQVLKAVVSVGLLLRHVEHLQVQAVPCRRKWARSLVSCLL